MERKDIVMALKELILPELKEIRHEQAEIKTALALTNKRLDDISIHLADQSRRIDETNKRIDMVREELTGRIDAVREELTGPLNETNKRIDAVRQELTSQIDRVRAELASRLDETNKRIDETHDRLNRLYEAIVRRSEHEELKKPLGTGCVRAQTTDCGLRPPPASFNPFCPWLSSLPYPH